jgi:hypothetical protein
MTAALWCLASKTEGPPPPSCAHLWKRRPDRDPNVFTLAYECEWCGAHGERRFGTQDDIRVRQRPIWEFYAGGRDRTENDRRIFSDRIGNGWWTRGEHLRS